MTVTAFDVISPVDETVVRTVPFADRAEVDARVERAHCAFAAWRAVAPGDRARLLRRFAVAVDGDIETLAALEVRNAGHTIGNARWEAGKRAGRAQLLCGRPGAAGREADPGARRHRRHLP